MCVIELQVNSAIKQVRKGNGNLLSTFTYQLLELDVAYTLPHFVLTMTF